MPLKTTHAAGEPIKAADMNDTVKGVLQNSHNIIELFLENYFASKFTPFNGLFFDGFSDTAKTDETATTLNGTANSGQAILPVVDTTGFIVGHSITIFDDTNLEEKIIQSVDSGVQLTLTTNLVNTFLSGDDVKRTSVDIDTANKQIKFLDTGNTNSNSIDLERSSSQHLFITNANLAGMLPVTDFTMEHWFKPELLSGGIGTLIAKHDDSTAKRSFQLFYNTDGSIEINLTDDGSNSNTHKVSYKTDASHLTDGIWTHIAFSFDISTETAIFYINGEAVASSQSSGSTIGAALFSADTNLNVGATRDVAISFADGLFDDVRFWSDVRTPTEIKDNYRLELIGSEGGLVLNLKLNNDLLDETSNNNDFTNSGAAPFSTDVAFVTGVGNKNRQLYFSKLQSFQNAMASTRLWIVRSLATQFNLAAGISAGATTLTIAGVQTDKFADGDIIDISTSDNLVRERKTLTATPSFSAGFTTLTFSATDNAFTTADFVERVDVIPEISVVDKDAEESFSPMTLIGSIVDFANGEVEDEYSFDPVTANEDVVVKLELTREDTTLSPVAKRLGVSLSE